MLKISDIKRNDRFYENLYGFSDEYVAVTDAYTKDNGWAVLAENTATNMQIEFYVRGPDANVATLDTYAHYAQIEPEWSDRD